MRSISYILLIYLHSILERRKEEVLPCMFYRKQNWGPGQVEALPKNAQLASKNLFPAPLSPHLMSSYQVVLSFCGQQDISGSHILCWRISLALMETQNTTSVGATPSDVIIAEITLFWNFYGSILWFFSLTVKVLRGHTHLSLKKECLESKPSFMVQ